MTANGRERERNWKTKDKNSTQKCIVFNPNLKLVQFLET